eukprot:TRINITY_DN396_c0_g1_i2.p1 TRINITY_DN396_c0_g1~~TRINITY_DN396_c0_g1_i2.p1  ORF type:complete len:352 (-),score=104.29 TRINITY_DN396_c0_g1_i2:392-1447(-)
MASRAFSRLLTRSARTTALGGAPNVAKTRANTTSFNPAVLTQARGVASHARGAYSRNEKWGVGVGVGLGVGLALFGGALAHDDVDYLAVRAAIADMLEDQRHDDGSWGPILVRLAWHASGTFDVNTLTGGSNGATMRFPPECKHGANAGLGLARDRLEAIKRRFPGISYADLWTLAGVVAIEEMGGPKIKWTPGRTDAKGPEACPPDGRLPDASQGASHVRDIFYRMGFSDREIVALAGAHVLGRCHTDRSGYSGPWVNSPTTFSNDYFVQLSQNRWTPKRWDGPFQYEDPTGQLMMLPADMALMEDDKFRPIVLEYAENEEVFFRDFSAAFARLISLGCTKGPLHDFCTF